MKKYFLKRINEIKELDITDIVMCFAALGLDIDPWEMDRLNEILVACERASRGYFMDMVDLLFWGPYFLGLDFGLNTRQASVLLTLIHCHLQAINPPPSVDVPPAHAQLVSRETGVGREEAIATLKQTHGDLAKAILLLIQRNPEC